MNAVQALERDPADVRFSRRAFGLLAAFNDAGVLNAADVHVAVRLCELVGEGDESVALALALAVRAPRLGHVHVDLERIHETAALDREAAVELEGLPWPDPERWRMVVAGSPVVGVGEDDPETYPFRLLDSWLYLDRYLADERRVAADLLARAAAPPPAYDASALASALQRLFASAAVDDRQRQAARTAAEHRLSVIAGGPGTGKTTTVARIAALVAEQAVARGQRPPLIALAAPTAKAAARLEEAVHEEARKLDISAGVHELLSGLEGMTLHRLLGRRPDSDSRFRHDKDHRLPHDLVVVDETSMVPLSLMARLLEAVRPQARLVLVGDPNQLASIEAGAVLGDIVAPALTGQGAGPIAGGLVVLDRVHRYGGVLAELAEAIRRGDADRVIALLRDGADGVEWVDEDAASLQDAAVIAGRELLAAAEAGDGAGALDALRRFRILCAHRREVASWTSRVQGWLARDSEELAHGERFYVGRPLLVTENDYELGLFNGDTGVIIRSEDGRAAATFERRGQLVGYAPVRLGAIDTVYAMTIHKSQGSQFDVAAVVLPDPDSRILTRELLYTAFTRARTRLIVAGSEETIRVAVQRPIARASGLRPRLWERER